MKTFRQKRRDLFARLRTHPEIEMRGRVETTSGSFNCWRCRICGADITMITFLPIDEHRPIVDPGRTMIHVQSQHGALIQSLSKVPDFLYD